MPAMALAVAGMEPSLRNPFTLSVAMRMSCGSPESLKSGSCTMAEIYPRLSTSATSGISRTIHLRRTVHQTSATTLASSTTGMSKASVAQNPPSPGETDEAYRHRTAATRSSPVSTTEMP